VARPDVLGLASPEKTKSVVGKDTGEYT